MMSPKEKAKELIFKSALEVAAFSEIGAGYSDTDLGKPVAIITVNEVIDVINKYSIHSDCPKDADIEYWEKVKYEIYSSI